MNYWYSIIDLYPANSTKCEYRDSITDIDISPLQSRNISVQYDTAVRVVVVVHVYMQLYLTHGWCDQGRFVRGCLRGRGEVCGKNRSNRKSARVACREEVAPHRHRERSAGVRSYCYRRLMFRLKEALQQQ